MPAQRDWTTMLRWLQIVLIVIVFALDFAHGIRLGEHNIGFHPLYRLRQSTAVAISRLRDPPVHGYLAYQSVIDALNRHGFAVFAGDSGQHLDRAGWQALFADPARMDRALRDAASVPINNQLEPQLIRDNELAFADYIDISFRLFGLHMSSLYYLYFSILGISCLLFLIEFRVNSFLIFVLHTYLAGIFLLQNYVVFVDGMSTLANSRLFEALSLLPMIHIFALAWTRTPMTLARFWPVLVQGVFLAFLIDCRSTALWQMAAIIAAGIGVGLKTAWTNRTFRTVATLDGWNGAWPAMVAAAALGGHMALIDLTADARYKTEPKRHVVWHEVLLGILGASPKLQKEYLGEVHGISFRDNDADTAVYRDLLTRNDTSSPVVVTINGRVSGLDPDADSNEWERLQHNLVFEIIRKHPREILEGLYIKFMTQFYLFTDDGKMSFANFRTCALLAVIGALSWFGAAPRAPSTRALIGGVAAALVILACAAAPVVIEPSILSVGTLLCCLVAAVVGTAVVFLGGLGALRDRMVM
jgi:hypothetical protein